MYRLPMLENVPGLQHVFSTVRDGDLGFGREDDARISENRRRFGERAFGAFDLGEAVALVPMRPGYEETIALVTPEDRGRGMKLRNDGIFCEAAITATETFFLAAADCYPIFVVDPKRWVLALIHASRESTVREIPRKTVEAMASLYGSEPPNLWIGIGPGIRAASYEVVGFSHAGDQRWKKFVKPSGRPNAHFVDLLGYIGKLFTDLAIPQDHIAICPADTFRSPRFFSHRRAKAADETDRRHAVIVRMVRP